MAEVMNNHRLQPNQHQPMQQQQAQASNDPKKQPDVFKNVPDIIEERKKDMDGNYNTINRYVRGNLLGKGGFAQVFNSTNAVSKQKYALKIVAKCSLTKARARMKLQTEIKIHRSLNHINIVRFESFFEDSNYAYLLLELCSNNAMSDLLNVRKRVTEVETKYYMHQLVNSLQYLHKHLVIHRDLKLGNLFLDADMRIKVGDFGLAAKLESPDERRMTVCGTPNYIAPELLEGKKGHSFEVDIWSTGVIMYTLLVGKPPYQSKDVKSTYKRILANAYSYPDNLTISMEAKSLISKMLQLRPESRATLSEILEHPFLQPGTVPISLPQSALKEIPQISQLSTPVYNYGMNNQKAAAFNPEKKVNNFIQITDENDPNVLNRIQTNKINTLDPQSSSATAAAKSLTARMRTALTSNNPNVRTTTATMNLQKDYETGKAYILDDAATVSSTSSSLPDTSSNTVRSRHIKAQSVRTGGPSPSSSTPISLTANNLNPMESGKENINLNKFLSSNDSNLNRLQQDIQQIHIVENKSVAVQPQATVTSPASKEPATEAMMVCTPPDQIMLPTKDFNNKRLGTLETMHDMLNTSFSILSEDPSAKRPISQAVSRPITRSNSSKDPASKVWVVRYVDYTSKYGLGFLFNNGSAGVYFNDSTKIVLSADGKVFQYIERKKKESSFGSEHSSQKYYIDSYPMELQKKVTLLKHFRNYLLDEERANPRSMNHEQAADMNALKTAFSKDYREINNSNPFDNAGAQSTIDDENDLPFLKKWVRTKHAILFRISNRTVQVVFYDRSEVLLSSEARVITYVNKSGERSEHALDDIMLAGRVDIAKRLKYTKDIMYRLIHQGR